MSAGARVLPRVDRRALATTQVLARLRELAASRRGRRTAITAALVALVLAVAYYAWLRDSSLVRVERVTITGLATPEAAHLRSELTAAGMRMTSLDVDEGALRHAVGASPLVRALSADGSFPHGLHVDMTLNVPVAALASRGRALPVAADGTLLPDVRGAALPRIALAALPAGRRLGAGKALDLVAVASAAPAALRARTAAVAPGIVATLRGGIRVIFGDGSRAEAKWAALAAVLADPHSGGATYVDVRDPAHPVAGGIAGAAVAQLSAAAPVSGSAGPGIIPAIGQAAGSTQQAAPPAVPSAAQPAAPAATMARQSPSVGSAAASASGPSGPTPGASPNARP